MSNINNDKWIDYITDTYCEDCAKKLHAHGAPEHILDDEIHWGIICEDCDRELGYKCPNIMCGQWLPATVALDQCEHCGWVA